MFPPGTECCSLPLVPLLVAAWLTPAAATPRPARAPTPTRSTVPGAELQRVECQTDLSATALAAKGRSDISDWAGLHSKQTVNPPAGAGIQIDGYFPDDSTTNTTNGWNHDSQFVIRLPENWNGQLVITGAPGVRKQYAPDYILSDWLLAQGYAYASTDKGNTGTSFYENGSRSAPGQAMREWHDRVSELTVAAKEVVAQRYGARPGPHLDDRHLQRRLPHPVAAGEPARPVRRRRRLGGHPDDRRRAQPLHLPADRAARVPAGRGRSRGPPADVRRRLRARLRGAVDRPLRRLLGPHPAQLPRGVRPRLRRRDQGGHAVLPDRRPPRGRRPPATPSTTTRRGRRR